jgi:hypothetical protein
MVTDGKSCEFFIFVISCSFASYELVKVFMNNSVQFGYGSPNGRTLCGVVLLGGSCLLDINQVLMEIEVKRP